MGLLTWLRSPAGPTATTQPRGTGTSRWSSPPAPFNVSATWLQVPTLRSAGCLVQVVGTSFNQAALARVGGPRTPDGATHRYVTAQLVREPSNPHDPDAVRVDIGNLPIGHIARDEAEDFHEPITALAAMGQPTTCRAWIVGGWDRGPSDQGSYGVRLDLHPKLEYGKSALMPVGDMDPAGKVAAKDQDYLASVLDGNAKLDVIAEFGAPAHEIGVWLEGRLVGTISDTMSERFTPWIRALQGVGLPATCEADLVRGARKIQMHIKLARPW